MGSTWTVLAWTKRTAYGDMYDWVEWYRGESFIAALRAMRRAKQTAGCVTLEWR
jgi:hypothetical protein